VESAAAQDGTEPASQGGKEVEIMSIQVRMGKSWLAVALLAGGACASVPPPKDTIAQADAAVARAKQQQVSTYAPLELRKAEEKLQQSKSAMADDRNLEAKRLAEQSLVDAELATVSAQKAESNKAAAELAQTVDVLKQEINRGGVQP
jgi:hypothetical protein